MLHLGADDIADCAAAKTANDAFCYTDLDHILRWRGVTHLLFSGCTTDVCVSSTMRHAADRTARAPHGQRNDTLNAETFNLTRFMAEGTLNATEIATTMAYAGRQAGLVPHEVKATLTSALAAGGRR